MRAPVGSLKSPVLRIPVKQEGASSLSLSQPTDGSLQPPALHPRRRLDNWVPLQIPPNSLLNQPLQLNRTQPLESPSPFLPFAPRALEIDAAKVPTPALLRLAPGEDLVARVGGDADETPFFPVVQGFVVLDVARDEGEEGVVAACCDMLARVEGRAALADEDVAREDGLAW